MMGDTLYHRKKNKEPEEMETIGPPDEPKNGEIWLNEVKITN